MIASKLNLAALRGIIHGHSGVDETARALGIGRTTLYRKLNGTYDFTFSEIMKIVNVLQLSPEERDAIFPDLAAVLGRHTPPPRRESHVKLLDFDRMLDELEALLQTLGDTRDHHLSHSEPMTEAQVELANTALWGAELGMIHLFNHYRGLVDKEIAERRKHG